HSAYAYLSALPPFPTRRSSDLFKEGAIVPETGGGCKAFAVSGQRAVLPLLVEQQLQGLEVLLVAHLAAAANPVTEVDVGQAALAAEFDLPEYRLGAEAEIGAGRIIEGVDGGDPAGEQVHHRHRQQRPEWIAEAAEAGVAPARHQETGELFLRGGEHVAVAVPALDVAAVELVQLVGEQRPDHFHAHAGVTRLYPALIA